MKTFLLLFALPCMLLGLLTQLAVAQNANSGVLQGIVSDSVGAVVPGVSVDVLNDQTGILQSTKTNSDGLYAVTSVPLGQYTITFSKDGFDRYVRQGVLIFVGTARLDAQLKIGQVSEQVTVTGQPPLLETETSDQTVTIEASTVQALPVMGADWRGVNGILPGVNAGTLQNASGQWSGFNGTQTATTAWVFNGQGAVLPFDYNPGQNFPPSDAVDEINASTSNFSAQYGNGASVFNMITKSGTNRFHGTVFEQFQNNALEARNYFAQSVTPLSWNEAGASIGGPFMKDKLFFFFTFMANPNSTTSPSYFTFPTDAMKRGDFSDLQFPTIYDPASLDYSSGKATRTALPGNQVTTIDPVAAAIQKFWPKPNNLGAGGNSLYNNYYAGVKNISDWQWWVYKVDYQVNDRNRLSFAGQLQPQDRESPDPRCPANCFPGILQDQAGEVTYTTTFNASMANEARAGYVRELTRFHSPTKGKGYPAALGLINAPADVFPLINVSGVVSSELDAGTDTVRAVGVGQYSDVLSLVKGKHILKIGGEYDRSYGNLSSWGDISAGNFFFNGIATRNPADPTSTGLGYADFLFGLPQSWNVTESVEDATHYSAAAAFVQDDYKVRKNLTLNLGLRWEYLGSWLVHDNSSSTFQNDFGVFDPTLLNPATGTNGAMVFGGQNGRNSVYDPNPHNFVPRVGFAWNPLPKWAVRGSYGMFDLARAGGGTETPFLGVASNTTGALTSPDNITPVFSLGPNEGYKQGYVQGPPKPISPTAGERTPQLLNGQNVSYEAKSIPTMYDQEIYLNVQREFSGDVLLSAGYVHTKGTHLGFERDINQVPEALLGPGNAQSQRPYPQFQSISGLLWDARSNYDALQLRAEKRLSHGLYFVANYTWSKILDTATTSGASGNLSGQDVYQRSYDTKANYGLSVQAHLAQAQLDLSANSPAQAINQFKAVLAIDKNNATALANLGALTYLQGDCAGAVPYFQHALKLEPTFSKTKGLLAICETMMGDPSAQSLLEASFSELKDDRLRSQVGIQLVNLYYETGDFEHASTTIGALLQLNPDDTDVLYMAQRVYLEMADGTLNKLAIVAPKSARMQQVIAEHLINAGNVASAIEHYRAALKVNPRLPGVHFEIGECIMQLSTADTALAEAQKEFELALQYDGESARVEVRLGMIAAMSSRSDEAYEHYKRACDLNPHDVDAQMGLATALIHRDKPKDALPYLRNVVDADPMNTEARYRLAVVCKKLGLTEESAKQMTLFRQSKLLKNEVEGVFEQMNRPERKRPDEIVDKGK